MIEPRVIRTTDDYRQAIVRVELANRPGVFATVDEEDFHRMTAAGIKPRWVLNGAKGKPYYVRCYQADVAGGGGLVARQVLQAGRGQQVKYLNHDRLDLRKRNLVLTAGWAKGTSPNPHPSANQRRAVQFYVPDGFLPTAEMAEPDASCGLSLSPLGC